MHIPFNGERYDITLGLSQLGALLCASMQVKILVGDKDVCASCCCVLTTIGLYCIVLST